MITNWLIDNFYNQYPDDYRQVQSESAVTISFLA